MNSILAGRSVTVLGSFLIMSTAFAYDIVCSVTDQDNSWIRFSVALKRPHKESKFSARVTQYCYGPNGQPNCVSYDQSGQDFSCAIDDKSRFVEGFDCESATSPLSQIRFSTIRAEINDGYSTKFLTEYHFVTTDESGTREFNFRYGPNDSPGGKIVCQRNSFH